MNELSATYDRYGVMLYRLCVVILANKEDAEDAVHETFLKYMLGSTNCSDLMTC